MVRFKSDQVHSHLFSKVFRKFDSSQTFATNSVFCSLLGIGLKLKHIGCFEDSRDRAIPEHLGTFGGATAVQKCANLAMNKGYTTFGVQNGGECWSGAEAGRTYSKLGKAKHNCRNGLGGAWANDVYQMVDSKHLTINPILSV